MRRFVETCEAVAATTKKTAKVTLVSELFKSLPLEDAASAAIFLTGRPFPHRDERVLGVGGSQLAKIVIEIAHADAADLGKRYRAHGDLGVMAQHLLLKRPSTADVSLQQLAKTFNQLPEVRTAAQKMALIKNLFEHMSAGEVKYTIKIMTGDLRIGLKESLVEEKRRGHKRRNRGISRAKCFLRKIAGRVDPRWRNTGVARFAAASIHGTAETAGQKTTRSFAATRNSRALCGVRFALPGRNSVAGRNPGTAACTAGKNFAARHRSGNLYRGGSSL